MLDSHYSPLSFSSSLLPSLFRQMRVQVTQALLQRCLCVNSDTEDSFLAFSWTFILHQCSDFFLFIFPHHHTRLPPLIIILMMVQLGLTPSSLSIFCYLFSSCSSLAICLVMTFVFFSDTNYCIFSNAELLPDVVLSRSFLGPRLLKPRYSQRISFI